MEPTKPHKIPRPDCDLPPTDKPVVRPTVERMMSGRVRDTKARSIDFDNTVLMNMGEGMYTVNAHGCVTSMNHTAEMLFQWTFEEMIGHKMHDLTHYAHRDGTPFPPDECAGFGVLSSGKSIKNYEDVFIRRDGTFFDVIYSSSPIREDGEITGLVVVFRDVSEQNRTLAALRESEERFEKAFNASPMALLLTSGETRKLVEVNDTFVELFGYSREEVIGRTTEDFGLWADPAEREAEADVYRSTGRIRNAEHRFRTRSGGEIICLLSAERIEINGEISALGVLQDITDHRRAEKELKEAERRYRLAQQVGNVGIWDWNAATGRTYWSETMWDLYGETQREVNPDEAFWSNRIDGQDRDRVVAHLRSTLESGEEEYRDEFRTVPIEGAVRWIESVGTIERDSAGRPSRMYGVNLDITGNKAIEERIRRSENELRVITDSVPALISYIDKEGRYRFVNKKYSEFFGMSTSEIIGMSMEELLGDEVFRSLEPSVKKVLGGEPCSIEVPVGYKVVGRRYMQASYVPDRSEIGDIRGFYSLVNDLTEKMQYEEELRRANDELEVRVANRTQELAEANALLLRQVDERVLAEEQRTRLLRRLFTMQEDERGRIARDIHDQLGQSLTALRLKIHSLKDLCPDDSVMAGRIDRLQEIAEHLDGEVSFVAWELRPSVLDDVEFVKALENYVSEWSRRSDIFTEFDAIGLTGVKIDEDIENNLYRITQEALSNAAKHARAKTITVVLEMRDKHLILIVEDDGSGFDPESIEAERGNGGFGLFGMRERAALVSGTLEIESSPNKGTSVFVRVPLILEK